MGEPTNSVAQGMQPVRERISDALHHWLSHGGPWPPKDPARLRNLLLDASSSDHRALVELLLRVARHGVADGLRAMGPCTPAEWASRRTSLVTRTTGELFIDSELAAWAVDSWAVALGVITPAALVAQRAANATAVRGASVGGQHAFRGRTAGHGVVQTRGAGGASASGATGGMRAIPVAALPGAPSWAGGSQATRVGAIPSGTGMRVIRGWQGSPGPVPMPNVRLHMMVMGGVMLLALAVVLLAPRDRGRVGLDPAPPASPAAAESRVMSSVSNGDSSRARADAAFAETRALEMGASEAGASNVGASNVGASNVAASNVGASNVAASNVGASNAGTIDRGALDTIRLRNGRTLIGSIRLVAPTALFVYDVATGLEYTMPFAQVASVVTHTGASLPLPESVDDDGMAVTAALLERGVGGSYRVEQHVRSVDGNAMCGPVAAALGREVIRSVEEFRHVPGSRDFVLASRPGVRGVIDASARFTSIPYTATRDGVRFTFRMSGHFTPGGFAARTLTETEANIRYRRMQSCRIVADLLGTRVVPAAAGPSLREPASGAPRSSP